MKKAERKSTGVRHAACSTILETTPFEMERGEGRKWRWCPTCRIYVPGEKEGA